jgi:acyl-CoA ligase (AMP-forming) (exosortase A-associated)
MPSLLHHFIDHSARRSPDAPALLHKDTIISYAELHNQVQRAARGLAALVDGGERVAVYLPKQAETVLALFGASAAGAVFVPVNPILKPAQVGYILRHCNVRVLVTSADRAELLSDELAHCHDLRQLVIVGDKQPATAIPTVPWAALLNGVGYPHRRIDGDMAAILYTSGSTGQPKGVVLSQRNLVAGAESVADYLRNSAADRLLAALPFSFDYGLSQLTTAFSVGASVVLMEYLLPRDVLRAITQYDVTGLAAVPPLWNQLATLDWPDETKGLRYITNSGGGLPRATATALRAALPNTDMYLMYGLTEAFRSTYLSPEQVDARPDSIGMAIPNADVRVLREDGSECAPGEPGELVHRGALVALGYWNDKESTAERFRPVPGQHDGLPHPELAVWSGDQVRRDADGYLYFVARKDEMIKTSGYRVSPTEVEEVVFGAGNVAQAVALGVPHPMLGQAIVLVVQAADSGLSEELLLNHCKRELPTYMVPAAVFLHEALPCNANGKIDRAALAARFHDLFNPE